LHADGAWMPLVATYVVRSMVCVSVCLCIGVTGELDQDAICVVDSWIPRNRVLETHLMHVFLEST